MRVAVGFGVDTAIAPNSEIFNSWRQYLESGPGCGNECELWSEAEKAQWEYPDLLCSYVYQGFTRFRA